MTAVGDAAFEMIKEIRRQFREIKGLLEGEAEPDTARCVDIATTAALNKMIAPGVIAVAAPIIVGVFISPEALGGMLAGGLLGCVLLALTMANAGGAWDNAKKYVEKGNFGGKGTETHAAAVVGDTVGDPSRTRLAVDEYSHQRYGHRVAGYCPNPLRARSLALEPKCSTRALSSALAVRSMASFPTPNIRIRRRTSLDLKGLCLSTLLA